MRLAIILNAGPEPIDETRCDGKVQQIKAAFAPLGIEPEIILCPASKLTRTAQELSTEPYDMLVAGGGDGTVSSIATGLVDTQMPLAVLPLGTLNHFARDLKMPDDLAEAAKAIRDGVTQAIDVGEVNGRVFVNNSSIGLYPDAVMVRDDQQRRHGLGKWTAMFLAACRVMWRFPLLAVHVAMQQRSIVTKTPFVFVGNNEYQTGIRSLGQREHLDRGELAVYTVRCRGRAHMLWLILRGLFGSPEQVKDFEVERVSEAKVHLKRRALQVGMDGEVVRLASPLVYRCRAGALIVRRARTEAEKMVEQPPPLAPEEQVA
ncbi:MAG: diacylglycerol kinase family protein [Kofleriaceae bacterium]